MKARQFFEYKYSKKSGLQSPLQKTFKLCSLFVSVSDISILGYNYFFFFFEEKLTRFYSVFSSTNYFLSFTSPLSIFKSYWYLLFSFTSSLTLSLYLYTLCGFCRENIKHVINLCLTENSFQFNFLFFLKNFIQSMDFIYIYF